jgi:ABC-type Zn2+ transport system substrate-binding protein/surface adhesin
LEKKVILDGEDKKEEEAEEDDDDEESDASFYNSEDDENNEFEEACPEEFDIAIWNNILEMREKRLDQEEILTEIQKAVEVF